MNSEEVLLPAGATDPALDCGPGGLRSESVESVGNGTNGQTLPVEESPRPDTLNRAVLLAWAVAVLLSLRWLDGLGAGRTFFFDEWNFVVERWRFEPDTFLAPHNGHLSVVPASVFYAMFEVVGLDNYRVFRVLGLLVHVAVATSVLVYVRRRLGPLAGLGAGVAILLLGTGWQNILWPFQIGFMGSVLFFVLGLLLLERGSQRADVGVSACVALALGCSGVGVAAAGAVLVETLFTRPWRRWWIALAPLTLYAFWYLVYGESQADLGNLDVVSGYVSTSGSAALAGLYDLTLDWGRLGLGVLVGLAAAALLHRRGVSPRVLALIAMLAAFWGLTALSRGQFGDPGASRYVYVGAVVIVLLVAELVPTRLSRTVAIGGLFLGLLSAWATNDVMRAGAGGLRQEGEIIGAELAVLEAFGQDVGADYPIDSVHAPGLLAGEYLEAIDGIGSSPAFDVQDIGLLTAFARTGADRVLFEVAPPRVRSGFSMDERCEQGDFLALDSARTIDPGSTVVLLTPGSGGSVSIGHWAPPSYLVEVPAQDPIEITFPDEPRASSWTLQPDAQGTLICVVD